MITKSKLEEYEQYHGYYDGFYTQKVKKGIQKTSDEEWFMIANFIQDIILVNKGLTSQSFSKNLNKRLIENCDNEETIDLLRKLANEKW